MLDGDSVGSDGEMRVVVFGGNDSEHEPRDDGVAIVIPQHAVGIGIHQF